MRTDRIVTAAKADRTPNWDKWGRRPRPKLWECVALSLNIDPDKVRTHRDSWMAGRRLFDESQEFKDRLDLACANVEKDGALRPTSYAQHPPNSRVLLCEFAASARDIGWGVPAELLAIADIANHAHSGKPTSAPPLEGATPASAPPLKRVTGKREARTREIEARNKKWQERIDALARDHPGKSHAHLCRKLAKEVAASNGNIPRKGYSFENIRRNTRLLA